MNWFDRQLVCLAVLLLGGCATTSLPPSPPLDGSLGACPSWRWVALKAHTDSACPLPHDDLDPVRSQDPSTPFCFYQGPDSSFKVTIDQLLSQGKLARADRDCASVGSLASTKGTDLLMQAWPTLQGHFDVQVGRSELWDATGDRRNVVRLAVLDTQPTDLWKARRQGRSPHGWSLAHIGRHLVCPGGEPALSAPCVAEVTTRLALPWRDLNPRHFRPTHRDEKRGGYFGTVFDLAKAIGRELAEVQGSDERLVLNLSVGWDGEAFGGLETDVDKMPVPAQLLYRVLEEAACQGALIIAAAGNRVGGPEPEDGLLLPAAWAGRTAACTDGPRPMVYAVGGVDSRSKPLSNAREDGMPELVAFADHAVVGTFDPALPTKTYTGSSVAAAVASAAAAAVWSERPKWAARKVMETLYHSGCEIAEKAHVMANPPLGSSVGDARIASLGSPELGVEPAALSACLSPPCVRRVCLRRALCEARRAGPGGPGCAQEACPRRELPQLSLVSDAEQTGWGATGPSGPSERFESVLARPWTGPQPQDPPCPNCTLEPPPTSGGSGGGDGFAAFSSSSSTGDYTLHIEIDGDWPSTLPLYQPTLRLGDALLSISLPAPGVLRSGDELRAEHIPGHLVQDALDASEPILLEFVVYEDSMEKSVESPVLVVR